MLQRSVKCWLVRGSLFLAIACLLASTGGCGRSVETPTATDVDALTELGNLYGDFASVHGRGPSSIEEFKSYVDAQARDRLERLGFANAEELLTSPRDGKPYVLVLGIVPNRPLPSGSQHVMSYELPVLSPDAAGYGSTHSGCIVAYEQEGLNGKRRIVYLTHGGDPTETSEMQKQVIPGLR